MPEIEEVPLSVRLLLNEHGMGFDCAVEFGAGRFEKLAYTDAEVKVGIEACEDYILAYEPEDRGMVVICGDMRDYPDVLPVGYRRGLALLIDSIEHIEEFEGRALVEDLQEDFERILVVTPDGFREQTSDAWGFGNDHHQTHKSGWTQAMLEDMGFRVQTRDLLLMAVWNRDS